MRTVYSVLRHIVRALIAIAAVANLAALFVFSYRIPSRAVRALQPYMPAGIYMTSNFPYIQKGSASDAENASGNAAGGGAGEAGLTGESELADGEAKAEGLEAAQEAPATTARMIVPSQAINYNGGDLDLLDGVYIQYPDGTRLENVKINTTIEEGNTRLDKVVYYDAVLDDGAELTGKRTIRIGSRYTGPSLTVTGEIPEVSPEVNYRWVVREQIKAGNVYAEDGFGNDITGSVQGRMEKEKGEEEGEILYRLVLYVTNAVGDTAETVVQDDMVGTGVVCKLTTNDLTLAIGTPFYFQDYVAECHDSHGNALSPQVSGIVNSYAYGDYSIDIWCTDENGVSSPIRTLNVHIV